MDIRLFISTFLLIFLAELGDKTQLTAMARAAGSDGAKWTVFAAAAAALLLSTLLAVTLGRTIARFVPDHIVRLLAALLFISFGMVLLVGALQRGARASQPVAHPPTTNGMMMRAIMHIAAEFEEASAADYAALARETNDPAVRRLLLQLEADERAHLQMMHTIGQDHAETRFEQLDRTDLPSGTALQHDVALSDRPILTHALEHEQATMQFYLELANRTPIPALQRTFTSLANAESAHIARIKMLLADHRAYVQDE